MTQGPTRSLWGRLMQPNFASIMPQVIGVWCEQAGHDVRFVCYTGGEDLTRELPSDTDVLFVGAYTQSAHLAYAVSDLYRRKGVITVLGGPHARCYPADAARYFDYVLGFTDQALVQEVLKDAGPHSPGLQLTASRQPKQLPGIRQRWKFIAPTIAKTPILKLVPTMASLGCPYTCPFCIDAVVDYQPLDTDQIKEDLRFVLTRLKRPRVGWHDPNFGVRFDQIMSTIEESVPPDRIDFAAESSLSLLSEKHLARLRANGFKAMLPGVESWYSLGGKSHTGSAAGAEKVRRVADHLNMVLRYIPYVQANFVVGLDDDEGDEPFELTKRFVDLAPGVFPAYSLLSAFGQAAPLNLEYQKTNRVLGFPFHFLNNHHAMNVKPANYSWPDFYDHVIDVTEHTFSWPNIGRRFAANRGAVPRWMNLVRAVSSEGFGRMRYFKNVRRMLEEDRGFRAYFEQETDVLPEFYVNRVKHDLGTLWEHLPEGALYHDAKAFLKASTAGGANGVAAAALAASVATEALPAALPAAV